MATKEQREAMHAVLQQLAECDQLTPDNVIEAAKLPDSPLHIAFTWDMQEAALKTWRHEARILISGFRIEVVIHRKTYNVSEFVESTAKGGNDQGYVSFASLRTNKDLAREFVDRELGVAATYVSKTKEYAEILGLRKRVEGVVEEIESVKAELWGRPQA